MRKILLVLVFLAYEVLICFAQETIVADKDSLFGTFESDEDELFGSAGSKDDLFNDSSFIEEINEENTVSDMDELFLVNEAVTIGGSYQFSLTESISWNETDASLENILEPTSEALSSTVSAKLELDARPDADFRFFTKAGITYPFQIEEDDVTGLQNVSFSDIVSIQEMFSDFNYDEKVFFRVGKTTINWGVGYLFSPADIVNITPIDPENPDRDREGPVSFKMHYPFNNNSAYLYLIADNVISIEDLGIAVKGEFLLNTWEIGVGASWGYDDPVYGMATLTGSLWDFNVYGEAVISYGMEKRFVEETAVSAEYPLGLMVTQPDDLFFSGTAGFSYSYSDDNDYFDIFLSGQYMYNGQGYEDDSILDDLGVMILIGAGDLAVQDLLQSGRHYAGATFTWRELLGTDITLAASWVSNLSDLSGRVIPALSFELLNLFDFTLSVPISYGDSGTEYSPQGDNYGLSFTVRMGSGSF